MNDTEKRMVFLDGLEEYINLHSYSITPEIAAHGLLSVAVSLAFQYGINKRSALKKMIDFMEFLFDELEEESEDEREDSIFKY